MTPERFSELFFSETLLRQYIDTPYVSCNGNDTYLMLVNAISDFHSVQHFLVDGVTFKTSEMYWHLDGYVYPQKNTLGFQAGKEMFEVLWDNAYTKEKLVVNKLEIFPLHRAKRHLLKSDVLENKFLRKVFPKDFLSLDDLWEKLYGCMKEDEEGFIEYLKTLYPTMWVEQNSHIVQFNLEASLYEENNPHIHISRITQDYRYGVAYQYGVKVQSSWTAEIVEQFVFPVQKLRSAIPTKMGLL